MKIEPNTANYSTFERISSTDCIWCGSVEQPESLALKRLWCNRWSLYELNEPNAWIQYYNAFHVPIITVSILLELGSAHEKFGRTLAAAVLIIFYWNDCDENRGPLLVVLCYYWTKCIFLKRKLKGVAAQSKMFSSTLMVLCYYWTEVIFLQRNLKV